MGHLPGVDRNLPFNYYVHVLRRRKWWALATLVVIVGVAVGLTLRQTPIFVAEAQILIKGSPPPSTQVLPNLETEAKVAQSEVVAARAADQLEEVLEPKELLSGLSIHGSPTSQILVLRYSHPDPMTAGRRVEALADAYLDFRREQLLEDSSAAIEGLNERIQSLNFELESAHRQLAVTSDDAKKTALQLQVTSLITQISGLHQKITELAPPADLRAGQLLNDPEAPRWPSSPNLVTNLTLAMVLGALLGVGIAFLRDRSDRSVRDRSELAVLADAEVLGVIPRDPHWRNRDEAKLVTLSEPVSPVSEGYRALRASLLFSAARRDAKVIMVTSPQAGEGKTTLVANLGTVLARSGNRVILVSADLRRPRLEWFFGVTSPRGLSGTLSARANPWESLVRTRISNLSLLPSGPILQNPGEVLASGAIELLRELRQGADFVLLDTPPVLVAADALSLTSLVDGVLVLAAAGSTTRGAIHQTRQALEQADVPVLGWVLNGFDPKTDPEYSYGPRYYYTNRERPPIYNTKEP